MVFRERESDGAVHWKSMSSKLRYAFPKDGGDSSKTRFEFCKNSCNDLLYIRAIQGRTGGEVVAPELVVHVDIPFNWNEFLFHRGRSFNLKSISDAGIIAGGKESKEGRQTVFLTHWILEVRLQKNSKVTCESREK